LAERWSKPAVPIAIEPTDQVTTLPDGRNFAMHAPVLSAEDIERARLGYLCLKCLEPLERAWPERCPLCGAPIRREQAAYFAREFGEVKLGPSTTLEEELAGLSERREEEERNGNDTG
jgi:hypothetical protein